MSYVSGQASPSAGAGSPQGVVGGEEGDNKGWGGDPYSGFRCTTNSFPQTKNDYCSLHLPSPLPLQFFQQAGKLL